MPVLVLTITKDFDKLLENGRLTSIASLRKSGRIMVVAINVALVLVVAVLRSKDCWTYRACEVLNVVFSIQCGNVRATKCASTSMTEEIQSSEVICLTQGVLVWGMFGDGEELGCHNLAAVLVQPVNYILWQYQALLFAYLACKAFQMIRVLQRSYKLSCQDVSALPTVSYSAAGALPADSLQVWIFRRWLWAILILASATSVGKCR